MNESVMTFVSMFLLGFLCSLFLTYTYIRVKRAKRERARAEKVAMAISRRCDSMVIDALSQQEFSFDVENMFASKGFNPVIQPLKDWDAPDYEDIFDGSVDFNKKVV